MTDTRPKAIEKAKQRAEKRNDDGQSKSLQAFESEREKAKNTMRRGINANTGQSVQKIAASAQEAEAAHILRVAAYCRVSTDDIDQVISIELQKNNYRDAIKENPQWKYAGTYVDDGFSGTNTEHRPAFRLMMSDAMAGRFDMIITKSVSRFARNLLDCISWVRKLQEHNPPIPVFFEQEHLNTMDSTSNIILFVLAMVAEEESHMKSEAMLLSLEWRFSRGRFMTPKLLGYDNAEVDDGYGGKMKQLVVNEDQARAVRLMYYMLLSGSTVYEIADTLTELGLETGGRRKVNGEYVKNTRWTPSGVTSTMRNERYAGDVLARKTWTPNFRTHKSVKNTGEKNRYYQPAHHEAIVTRTQWNAAQKILNSRKFDHTGGYFPMRVVKRGALRGYISMYVTWAGYELDEYYRVSNIAMGMEEGDLSIDLGAEHLPDAGRKIAALTGDSGIQRIARELSAVEQKVKEQLEGTDTGDKEAAIKPVKPGFQVVSGAMFSHIAEPVVRFNRNTIAFNSLCIQKLNKIYTNDQDWNMERCQYVELLMNPVERTLLVRPCAANKPNAIKWADDDGGSVSISAAPFCRTVFALMDWSTEYNFRVRASLQHEGDDAVLFFDLDDYIGVEKKKPAEKDKEQLVIVAEERADTKGIFYAADDEPQKIEDVEAIEERLRQVTENEKRSFGMPLFEHNSELRMPDTEGLMAEAEALDSDHRVDKETVQQLYSELEEYVTAPGATGDGKNDEDHEGGSENAKNDATDP